MMVPRCVRNLCLWMNTVIQRSYDPGIWAGSDGWTVPRPYAIRFRSTSMPSFPGRPPKTLGRRHGPPIRNKARISFRYEEPEAVVARQRPMIGG